MNGYFIQGRFSLLQNLRQFVDHGLGHHKDRIWKIEKKKKNFASEAITVLFNSNSKRMRKVFELSKTSDIGRGGGSKKNIYTACVNLELTHTYRVDSRPNVSEGGRAGRITKKQDRPKFYKYSLPSPLFQYHLKHILYKNRSYLCYLIT